MLKVFAGGRSQQILMSAANDAGRKAGADFQFPTIEKLEKPQGVLAFLVCGFFENIANLNISLFFGSPREIGITVSCLGLPGKGTQQVVRRPTFSELSHFLYPFCLR
jgi:hypothetical protein